MRRFYKAFRIAGAGLLLACGFALAQAPQPSPSPTVSPSPLPSASPVEVASGVVPALMPPINLKRIAPWVGLNITTIQAISSSAMEGALRELPLQSGDKLDKVKLRQGIRRMYESQRFADIRVEADRSGDGVGLTFYVVPNFFIGTIHVMGAAHPPNEIQLINATKLQPGTIFDQAEAEHGIEGILRLLRDNGYYQDTAKLELQWQPETQQVNLLYLVTRGKPARIGQVTFNGDSGYTQQQVLKLCKLHPGGHITADLAEHGTARLRSRYEKQGRLEAHISITRGDYHPESNTVDILMQIDRGPLIDIQTQGMKLSKDRRKRYIPIYQENAVDQDLVNEGARNLRDYLQTQGYFDADVQYQYQPAPQGQTQSIIYTVDRGERHKVVAIVFDGNKYFPDGSLEDLMQVQKAALLDREGRFSNLLLAGDVKSIQNLYRNNGFENVKVTSEVIDDYAGITGNIKVLIHVVEGDQIHVGKLTISGNKAVSREQLDALLSSQENQPFSATNLETDREALANYYYNAGFPAMQVDVTATPDPADASRREVSITIQEGEQVFVDHILITGLNHTRESVVDGQMKLHPGEPLSQNSMLDSEHGLYNLGIFNAANFSVQNPDGAARQKNVLLQLDEAPRYTFSYGLGFEVQTGQVNNCSNHLEVVGSTLTLVPNQQGNFCSPTGSTGVSPQGSFDISRINFDGRDQNLIFQARVSTLQQRVLAGFENPNFLGNQGVKFSVTGLYDKTQNVLTFSSSRLEGSVQFRHKLHRANTLLYRFFYRRVDVDASTLQVSPDQIPLLSRPVRVGGPGTTFIRDTRDSPLDSHKGAYNTVDLSVAASAFGSESSFSRLLLQNSTYYKLTKRRNWVLARSLQLGIEEPFGMGTQAIIPLPEEFFAGGTNSHRGFALNQAGPRDPNTGFPLGGNALFVNNIELRTPPLPIPALSDNLSMVVFHDFGNVFDTTHDMFKSFFKVHQNNLRQCLSIDPAAPACDFNYMSHAVGTGARYHTPIGPVRVDFSYNLNAPEFPVKVVFDPVHELRNPSDHAGRFNFFFSIGQTF